MSAPQCQATNTAGEPCQAQPVRPSGFCYWHDASLAEERAANNRRGGKNRSARARARKLLDGEMTSMRDVRDMLMLAIVEVRDGTMDPKVGTAMATAARAICAVAVSADFEVQLDELRRQLNELNQSLDAPEHPA